MIIVTAAAVVVVGSACGTPRGGESAAREEANVLGGQLDTSPDGVMGLVLGSSMLACSGVLVSSHVVLTAAHCLDDFPPDSVLEGSTAGGPLLPVAYVVQYPGYDRATLAGDIGVVVLEAPASSGARVVRALPMDPTLVGTVVAAAGFGASQTSGGGTGSKRSGSSRILEVDAASFNIEAAPSLPCLGDSGGPVFANGAPDAEVLGVVSHGDGTCATFVSITRADPFAESFVRPWMAMAEDRAAAPGARCYQPDNCAVGECYLPVDAPAFAYCAPPCAQDGDCPDGMTCQLARCVWPSPSPGAPSSPCRDSMDCAGTLCGHSAADQPGTCATLCFPDAPSCADGYACESIVDRGDVHACFRASPPAPDAAATSPSSDDARSAAGAGCEVAPRPSGRPVVAGAAIIAAATIWVRRGRRRRSFHG